MMEKVNNVSFEGVRITITIEDASASKEYSFKYNLQEGSKLVTSSVFVAAKIVKIKKYIKALGGIKATAEFIVGGTLTTAEAGTAIGNALLGLASETLGIAALEDNCL